MTRWTSTLAIACLLLGCTRTPPEPSSSGKPSGASTAGKPSPPPDLYGCSVDSDCTLSGRVFEGGDACCVSPCGTQAVNSGVLEGFGAACEGKFELSQCVREHCAPPPPTFARCVESRCAAVEGPVITRNCDSDSDCALTDIVLSGNSLCCAACPDGAINAGALRGFKAWCADQPLDEPCPEAECAPGTPVAACVAGQCTAREATGG